MKKTFTLLQSDMNYLSSRGIRYETVVDRRLIFVPYNGMEYVYLVKFSKQAAAKIPSWMHEYPVIF